MNTKINKIYVQGNQILAAEITAWDLDILGNEQSITVVGELRFPIEFSNVEAVEEIYVLKALSHITPILQQAIFLKLDGVSKTLGKQEHTLNL